MKVAATDCAANLNPYELDNRKVWRESKSPARMSSGAFRTMVLSSRSYLTSSIFFTSVNALAGSLTLIASRR